MIQAIKQSRGTLKYYKITKHKAGSYKAPNSVWVEAPEWSSQGRSFKLERRDASGNIRETNQTLAYEPPSAYQEDDTNAVSVPLDMITVFKTRYQKVKELLFSFSTDMPNVEVIWLRNNQMTIPQLNLANCANLTDLDISDNYIEDIIMPVANCPLSFAYIGGLYVSQPNPSMVQKIQQSAVDGGVTGGQLLDPTCMIYDDLDNHETLTSRGWLISHITMDSAKTVSSSAQSVTAELVSSEFDWEVTTAPAWCDVTEGGGNRVSGLSSNTRQNLTFQVEANSTGSQRSGQVEIRKLKDDGNEYQGRGTLTITQNA